MQEGSLAVLGLALVVTIAPVLPMLGVDAAADGGGAPAPGTGDLVGVLGQDLAGASTTDGDRFGAGVDVDQAGDTAVVGAPHTQRTGVAYVVERDPSTGWQQIAVLTTDDREAGDDVGKAVAISGDGSTVLLGAPGDDKKNDEREGAAYVFEEADGEWSQTAQLSPGWVAYQRRFGRTVDLDADGSTALMSTRSRSNAWGGAVGDLFVYEQTDDGWELDAALDSARGNDEGLAWWVGALTPTGDRVLAGASTTRDNGAIPGAAVVYEQGEGGAWTETAWLAPSGSHPSFGASVDVDQGIALVGAPLVDASGAAYVSYQLADGSWTQPAPVTTPLSADGARVGSSVDLLGTTALVGAPGAQNASLVVLTPAGGLALATLTSPGPAGDGFGHDVALSPTGAVIGAPSAGGGAAYAVPTVPAPLTSG